MISISLCGFLVALLGRVCSDCFVTVPCVLDTLLLVCRLCLESVYLGFMNFLFLMYVPPLYVFIL